MTARSVNTGFGARVDDWLLVGAVLEAAVVSVVA